MGILVRQKTTGSRRWLGCILAGLITFQVPAPGATRGCGESFRKVSPASVSAQLQSIYDAVVLPVLREGDREKYVEHHFDLTKKAIILRAKNGHEVYTIYLAHSPDEVYPVSGPPRPRLNARGQVTATFHFDPETSLSPENLRRSQGAFRSALRSLHPQLAAPGYPADRPFVPSYPQRDAIADLLDMASHSAEAKPKKPVKLGLMMPGASGKTVVVAKYVGSVAKLMKQAKAKGWKKAPKVLVLVNNIDILEQTERTFKRELGMTRFSRIYGDALRDKPDLDSTAQFTGTTPTSFLKRLDEFKRLLTADPDQPWVIFIDEAHHTETKDGQFQKIRQFIDDKLDGRHHVVLASAFFGYRDRSLFTGFLGGNIHAMGLSPEETTSLREGKRLVQLARAQQARAVMDGYIAPVLSIEIAGQKAVGKTHFSDILGDSYVEDGTRYVKVYHALLDDMAQRIKNNRQKGVVDRGVIFVDLTKRASEYAKELSKRLGVEVRAYYRGEESSPDAKDWISDRGKYDTPEDRRKHKYIVVVDILNEGFDAPGINRVIFARNYKNTPAGFSYFMQNAARGERMHSAEGQFKDGVVYIDYSGSSAILFSGLPSLMVEPPPGYRGPHGIHITLPQKAEQVVDPIEFEARKYEFFPELREQFDFVQNFPFFDFDKFTSEAVPQIRQQARYLGFTNSHEPKAAKRFALALAERLPKGLPGKKELIERLSDDRYWGWEDSDARSGFNKLRAAERIYRAIYEVAALYRLLPEGRTLDLTTPGSLDL